jgi:transposase
MKITTIGIDLAKTLFQLHGVDKHGKAGLRKQLKRKDVLSFFANLEPCLIGMEACGSAHYWARKLSAGPYGAADGAAVREAVREDEQERP